MWLVAGLRLATTSFPSWHAQRLCRKLAQAEALAEFTDVQMALNLHVNEEVRHTAALRTGLNLSVRAQALIDATCQFFRPEFGTECTANIAGSAGLPWTSGCRLRLAGC